MPEKIILSHKRAPGDVLCMTAVVRDIARTYPGRYEIYAFTSCKTLWDNNPYIAGTLNAPKTGMRRLNLTYGHHIPQANRKYLHFLTAFHRNFEEQTGAHVPVLEPKGDVHLSDWHKENSPMDRRYWVTFSGGKSDFTTKIWSAQRHQQVVTIMRQFGIPVVQGGALHNGHWHPPLSGVLNTLNQTNLRDMLWLIHHADGVICPITSAMHMAAALDRPCVVVAGGREHWWWEAYVNSDKETFGPEASGNVKVPHRYLHTQGLLDCCHDRGCWRNKVTTQERDKHKSHCKYPEQDDLGQHIPRCLKMITVDMVVDAVLSYYRNGTLEPIPGMAAPEKLGV